MPAQFLPRLTPEMATASSSTRIQPLLGRPSSAPAHAQRVPASPDSLTALRLGCLAHTAFGDMAITKDS